MTQRRRSSTNTLSVTSLGVFECGARHLQLEAPSEQQSGSAERFNNLDSDYTREMELLTRYI